MTRNGQKIAKKEKSEFGKKNLGKATIENMDEHSELNLKVFFPSNLIFFICWWFLEDNHMGDSIEFWRMDVEETDH